MSEVITMKPTYSMIENVSDSDIQEIEDKIVNFIADNEERFEKREICFYLEPGDEERIKKFGNKVGIIPYIIEMGDETGFIRTEMMYGIDNEVSEMVFRNTKKSDSGNKLNFIKMKYKNYKILVKIYKENGEDEELKD